MFRSRYGARTKCPGVAHAPGLARSSLTVSDMSMKPISLAVATVLLATSTAQDLQSQVAWRPSVAARTNADVSVSACFDTRLKRLLSMDTVAAGRTLKPCLISLSGGARRALSTPPFAAAGGLLRLGYDGLRGRVVCVVTLRSSNTTYETWEWNATVWTRANSTATNLESPMRRLHWDDQRKRLVMLSSDPGNTYGVYEYVASAWRERRVLSRVPMRGIYLGAAIDDQSRIMLLQLVDGRVESWLLEGAQWRVLTGAAPTPRLQSSLCFDTKRERFVLHGGVSDGATLGDSWEWQGAWQQRAAGASVSAQRYGHNLVFDGDACVAIGGYRRINSRLNWKTDEVLTYSAVQAASSSSFGRNCGGTLAPRVTTKRLPWLGQQASFSLTGEVSPWLVFTGASKSAWGSTVLPLDLSGIGMSKCNLLVSPDLVWSIGARTTEFAYPVLVQRSLVGQTYYHQVANFQPAANAAGLAWSGGLELRIGAP